MYAESSAAPDTAAVLRYIHIDIKAIPVHESLHFQISLGILYFILQRNGMQTSSKHITGCSENA